METAGGVLSPAPSGSSQADLYRPLRLPVLLVGDHRLGGIGTTISAWESLHIRGYDVQSIGLFQEGTYGNHDYLKQYFAERGVATFGLQPPPERHIDLKADEAAMREYYDLASNENSISNFTDQFMVNHDKRIEYIREMPERADKVIWHPFMQHTERSKHTIVAMDSAYGDNFQTYSDKLVSASQQSDEDATSSILTPAFDGSASWWTQGLGHGNPELALTSAHAAGRYGHVMFGGAVHEPALTLSETLVKELGNPRLSRVFFSDNGSTGMEVAVKMALKATSRRRGWKPSDDVLILGLKGSYHGDTIGTMDMSEPSIYNKKVEWYSGRGHWFDFPVVKLRKGQWLVESPPELGDAVGPTRTFKSLNDVFDLKSRRNDHSMYMEYFEKQFAVLEAEGKKFGALIMEPVLLGAGGMLFADPLFQHCLVQAVRKYEDRQTADHLEWRGMPVVFDEVFTGLYRLGRFSAATFLDVKPDIQVNAKLLTGGLLPLCTTTASESIFEAFLSEDKSDALLHGHSYTAHAIGCAVANQSLNTMMKMDKTGNWSHFKKDWHSTSSASTENGQSGAWSMWSQSFVTQVSHKANVDSVLALGSVLAISLKDADGAGYASTAATGFRDSLLKGTPEQDFVIHSRVLGNVLYLMAAMTTTKQTLAGVEQRVLQAFGA